MLRHFASHRLKNTAAVHQPNFGSIHVDWESKLLRASLHTVGGSVLTNASKSVGISSDEECATMDALQHIFEVASSERAIVGLGLMALVGFYVVRMIVD
mmetsp:Transcript_44148/g.95778  ORF Transcript_44148/g.95778 Transcript_44148/m.95778 type:complete len:99 (+) Transcript_44148:830-1126(+)